MTPAQKAPLRVAVAVDDPEHEEASAIVEWLARSAGVEALHCAPSAVAELEADVVWLHGVRSFALEALGPRGPDLLSRGRVLLTGGAAVLPAAGGIDDTPPNESGRTTWPDAPDEDGLPPVRGHASLRGHPLFDGLGHAPLTSAPRPGEEHTMVAYVLPTWPARAHVVAVERTRTGIRRRRATIWEYDRPEGRTLCIGGFLPFHSQVTAMRANTERLARNALARAAAVPRPTDRGETWMPPAVSAREDPKLAMPDLPPLEEPLGTLEFRLRTTGPVSDDTPFSVAGRRAFAAGGVARGIDEVWAHPVRVAIRPRIPGAEAESFAITPVGLERKLGVGSAEVIERVVVPRDSPVCVIEWLSATRVAEVEIGWTCDLRLAPPYPPGALGALRWRRCARGLVVAGSGEDRAVFVFSAPPALLDIVDVSDGDRAEVRVRARVDLRPGVSLRLAIVGGAGDTLIRRALAAADRPHAITRARRGHAERLMTQRLALDAPDPAAGQAIEWAKQRLDARLVEGPGVGRSLVDGYDSHRAAARFAGPEAARAALTCLAAGDFRTARDVLSFLGKHQDPSGRVLRECTTSGVARHDEPDATPLYLLLAARYLAWTGDLGFLRREWPRILRAHEGCRASESPETQSAGGATLALALPELADAAEAIGERGVAEKLRGTHGAAGLPTAAPYDPADCGPPRITDLVHGILGAEPDATRGRLVLRPVPPPSWHRFRVSGLAVGDTSVTLDYRRSDAVHTFRLVQDRGAAPLQLILEASLPGSGLRSAIVDGVAAALDARRDRDRIVVPVQVVLDHAREVALEMAQARQK
ncbi:MAG TPA: hypothetical protein VMM83_04760 [Longimicrobiales bacterium]|nr:hypothetical protein [Longimicrobiales bacterium]